MNSFNMHNHAGISTGGSCVVTPMFISEFAETSIRGLLGTGFQLFLTIGILMVFVIGNITNWVNLSYACGVVPILYVIGMLFVPESPTWLVKNVSVMCRVLSCSHDQLAPLSPPTRIAMTRPPARSNGSGAGIAMRTRPSNSCKTTWRHRAARAASAICSPCRRIVAASASRWR